MEPTGSDEPLVYMLGEAPGTSEDARGEQFAGQSGRILRFRIPDEWDDRLRWNNCVRTRPPNNRTPSNIEIESCRMSVQRDIAETQPKAVFGFGNIPLHWAIEQSKITLWRGRRVPINVGGHQCWFYPMLHPSLILHERRFEPRSVDEYGCPMEFAFALDLKRAFSEIRHLPPSEVITNDQAMADIEVVLDPDRAIDLIRSLYREKYVGLDYETNCLRPFSEDAKILTVALASPKLAFAFPLDHSQSSWKEADKKRVWNAYVDFLYEADCAKVSHHLPFELEWSGYFAGKECFRARPWEDSESQAYILDGRRGGQSLDFLCLQHFGFNLKSMTGNLDRAKLDRINLQTVLRYNALDAKWHRRLFMKQKPLIEEQELAGVYEEQMRRIPTLVLASMEGCPINQAEVRKLHREYSDKLKGIELELAEIDSVRKFKKLKGYDYRPSATQDTRYLCEKILQVEVESVDETVLEEIRDPATKLTLQWRKNNKLLSTYILPCMRGSPTLYPDGMLHPTLSTTTVITWRSSSDDPNVQNYPKHEDYAKKVRRMMQAPLGYRLVSFDYAGCQARNVAMESLDAKLINAFWTDYDIHADWRERIWKRFPKWMSKEDRADKDQMKAFRQKSKNGFVFPCFFGAQPFKTGQALGIPEEIMEEIHAEFFDEFHDIKRWQDGLFEFYYENGYVTGRSGFRRRAPVTDNQIINTPIQSDESLIVLDGMNRLSEMEDDRLQPILEVHDDLTFCWPEKEIDERAEIVFDTLLWCPFKWARVVPIGVEMSVGQNWGEMKDAEKQFSHKWSFRDGRKHTRTKD